jgi:hypothetical protein
MCTATRPYAGRFDRFRPTGADVLPVKSAAAPFAAANGGVDRLDVGLLATGALVVSLLVGLMLRRRTKRPA